MKRLRILYFSATGNTKRAVEVMRQQVSSQGIDTEVYELTDPSISALPSPAPGTETLIAFPALGFGAPHLVLNRARHLPEGLGTAASVLAVCGAEMKGGLALRGWPGSGPEQVERILGRKGYEVASTSYVSYPSNWTQVSDPPSGEARSRLLDAGDAETREFAAAAIAGGKGLYRCSPANRIWTAPVNFLFRAIGRRALGKLYAADPTCTSCGLCARSCPARSISMRNGLPAWRLSCEDCNRCINLCPAASIQVSAAKLFLYSALFVAGYAVAIAAGVSVIERALPGIGGPARALAILAILIAATPPLVALIAGPADALVRRASRIPRIGRIFSWGYTAGFGRYKEPGFRP
jgi:NAD-dependent dihydropyrimidine dehydrogenase PreA subunit